MRPVRSPWLALAALASLVTGCAELGPSRIGLSGRDLDQLQASAQPPTRYGVVIGITPGGALTIRGAHRMDPAGQTRIGLVPHPGTGSRNPVIPIAINGHPLTASVDTGASFSIITLAAAREAGVSAFGPGLIQLPTMTFGGARRPVLGIAEHLQVGDIAVAKVPLGILRRLPGMPQFSNATLAEVDVILGQDLLRQFGLVVFEGPARELRLTGPASDARLPPARVIDRIAWTNNAGGIPEFPAQISGRGPVPVVFDSGGGFGLWIPEDTAKSLKLADAGTPVELALVRPVLKPSTSRPARPSSLTVGQFVADALPTQIGMIHGGEHSPAFALLGNWILRSVAVAVDYRDRTLLFLRPEADRPPRTP